MLLVFAPNIGKDKKNNKKKNLSNECEPLKDSKKIPGIVLLVFAKGNEGNSGFARSEQGSILCM